jgi:hypothetical protein
MAHPVDADQSLLGESSAEQPLYVSVLAWLQACVAERGYSRPLCKRLAVLISGLIEADRATVGELGGAIQRLQISPAKEESIARRLLRMWSDPRLDPTPLVGQVLQPLLPEVLREVLAAHAASVGSGAAHHARFAGLRLVLDESSQAEHVHLLVIGLPIGGVVLPLAVRCWQQNAPLPEGEYWAQLQSLLVEVQALLPPELRAHVLLTADRMYGLPRLLDQLIALEWGWVLRVQGQTLLRLPDGTTRPLRQLVSHPGRSWFGGFGAPAARGPDAESVPEPVAVFKGAGWRHSQVVAVWAHGHDEPWLLLTSLPATAARLADYARRWAIERLFLSWKSHGWDLEACGLHDPLRLGRLLTGIVLATLWRLAMAFPVAHQHLADLIARAARHPRTPVQLRLPWGESPSIRPWAAKFSLLTWGRKVATATPLATHTPPLCWTLPCWEAATWKEHCRLTYQHHAPS